MAFFGRKKEMSTGADWLVVGLGNPGRQYEATRHNAGWLMLDYAAQEYRCDVRRVKFKGVYGKCGVAGQDVIFLKPETFMNSSGESVTEAMRFFHIPPERTIVIFDDISLDVGRTRIRLQGSDGGHNGMKNIIYLSGSDKFPRIKVGVGAKPAGWDLKDWVLSGFSKEEMQTLSEVAKDVAEAIKLMVEGKADRAMNKFNTLNKARVQKEKTE